MTNEQLMKMLEDMHNADDSSINTDPATPTDPATLMIGFDMWQGWLLANSPLGQQLINRIDNNGPLNPLAAIIQMNL